MLIDTKHRDTQFFQCIYMPAEYFKHLREIALTKMLSEVF